MGHRAGSIPAVGPTLTPSTTPKRIMFGHPTYMTPSNLDPDERARARRQHEAVDAFATQNGLGWKETDALHVTAVDPIGYALAHKVGKAHRITKLPPETIQRLHQQFTTARVELWTEEGEIQTA